MISAQIIEFSSKYCKSGLHADCSGKWNGFGFYIKCICSCHHNLRLNTKNIEQTSSCIISTSSLAKDKILLREDNEEIGFNDSKKNDLLIKSLQGSDQQASTANGDD